MRKIKLQSNISRIKDTFAKMREEKLKADRKAKKKAKKDERKNSRKG